ncbi:MAG: indolepyruvate oxidoreductase subunit beta family protein [Proteobacteria bacterium]|nr:indolepyruvate oxidoreductase subunit beta family protein [Pseudomonadota bacterium]
MTDSRERPLSVAILAVGGQGGGVLTKWLVDTAEANGYIAQSTFVAGVAQRTGATVYCVEMFPRDRAEALGQEPVFTPYPVPGDVDLVIVGEMAETGRAIQKGFVTPNITTLIASSHRIYSINEKEALGDGIMDQAPVARAAGKAAKKFICFDMAAAAEEAGCVISSVLLGAVAGAGALPFDRDAYEATIRGSGRAVEANLRGFAAGYDGVGQESPPADIEAPAAQPVGANGEALKARIESELPSEVGNIALHGALRALDYQDPEYAASYLDRVKEILLIDTASQDFELAVEVARQLALQMCYEDTIRVADLKTRSERFVRIREHVAATPNQPAHVVEYFNPRLEEICDTLPASLGALVLRSGTLQKLLSPFFGKGRNVKTTNISGFLLLHMLAKFKRWRRGTYRFKVQEALIADWLQRINEAIAEHYDYALAIAHCIEMVKGYGDTYQRGLTRYRAAVDAAGALPAADRAAALRRLHKAALADEKGQVFGDLLSTLETVH